MGCRKISEKFKFLLNRTRVNRTIWAVACAPLGSTTLGRETGDWWATLGVMPPGLKISNFWPYGYLLYFGPHFFLSSGRGYGGTRCVNRQEDPLQNNPQNWGFKNFWGRGTFRVCPLREVVPPIRFVLFTPLRTLIKTFFKWGESPHIWGRYRVSNIFLRAQLWPNFSQILTRGFSQFLACWKKTCSTSNC